ncbi:MAG: Nif3-like dinuclear metal center hexameric protein [Clostridia bacterium]|nr:Nif3-like dinuclear metal center hexameric protein [Clostridia bacterium]
MKAGEIYTKLCEYMPIRLKEDWDNSGFLLGDMNKEVKRVLVTLDVTADAAKEAKEGKFDLIVSHHPLIFTPLKSITSNDPVSRVVTMLIKNDISVISMHTNYDSAKIGVGDVLARALGVKNARVFGASRTETYMKLCVFVPIEDKERVMEAIFANGAGVLGDYSECSFSSDGTGTFKPLDGASPYIGTVGRRESAPEVKLEAILPKSKAAKIISAMREAHPYEEPAFDLYDIEYPREEYGYGKIGEIDETDFLDFARMVKKKLSCDRIRFVQTCDKVRRVAVGGGSCAFLIPEAQAAGADVFVTGDAKYHEMLDARESGMSVIAAGHFQTEDIAIPPLVELIKGFGDIYVKKSETHKACEQYL